MLLRFAPGSSLALAALLALVVGACAAPAATPESVSSPTEAPSPAEVPTRAPTAADSTEAPTPTNTPMATPTPAALSISPATLAQLRLAWAIDEPGNPNADTSCQDTACWVASRIGAYAFNPDSSLLAVGVCLDDPTENVTNPRHYRYECPAASEVRLYHGATGELESSLEVGGFPISLAFHPDGNLLAVGMADRQIEVWDLAAGEKIHQLDHSSTRTGVVSLTFSGDGTKLISEGDGALQVWDWDTPLMLARLDNVRGVSLDPAGRRMATRFWGGTQASAFLARIYDLEDLPQFRELDLHSPVPFRDVLFSPDGSYVVALEQDVVEIWDPVAETYLGKINVLAEIHEASVFFLWSSAFTPEGYLVVEPLIARIDPATPYPPGLDEYYCGFGLWDPRQRGMYAHHIVYDDCWADERQFAADDVYRIVVSPDGLRWAAEDGWGHLRVWAVDPAAPAAAPECLGTCG